MNGGKVESDGAQLESDSRLLDLQRMRLFATGLLVAMVALFIAASVYQAAWPWLAYVRAFAEASMVGACADWFAVVALFRHPFGIPIPHTAIIPRHKGRIAENFGKFIANNFLAPNEVAAKLESIDAAEWAARWLTQPANARQIAARLRGAFPSLLELLSEDEVRRFSRRMISSGIDSIAAAPLAARLLSVLVEHGHHETLFDIGIARAQIFIDEHKQNIRQRVAKNSVRWLPDWVDGKLTDSFLAELQSTLVAAHAPDHPWRVEYRAAVQRLVVKLADDPDMLQHCEQIKAEVLDNAVVEGYLDWLSQEFESKVQAELAAPDGILSTGLEHALIAFGNWLDNDTEIRAMINRWAQQLAFNAVVPNRVEIGTFVAEVVARWDTTTLVEKLELQVGKDLQYIRINGTLVGGMVGLGIHVAVRMLG